MTWELVAIALTLVVHVLGAGVLVWNLVDADEVDWRSLWPRDDDGGGGGWDPPGAGPAPDGGSGVAAGPGWAGPLPEAAQSAVRLREPGRIGDAYPRPARRPEHAPEHPRVPSAP